MTNSSDKQEHADWLEISESLGVDVSSDIEAWFNAPVEIEGDPPVDDGIETEVSPIARQLSQKSADSDAILSPDAKVDNTLLTAASQDSNEGRLPANPSTSRTKQPPVSKENRDAKRNEPIESPNNELGLDWETPVSKTNVSQSADGTSEKEPKRIRKSFTEAKSRETADKPGRTTSEPVKRAFDMSGWENLESELGITPKKPVESTSSGQDSEVDRDEATASEFGFERSDASKSTQRKGQHPQQAPESQKASRKERHPAKQKPAVAQGKTSADFRSQETSSFGAGLVDMPDSPDRPAVEAKKEHSGYFEPLGFFDSPKSQSEESETRLDESEIELIENDQSPELPEDELVESAWDEDFVEFEIQDLHPNPGREPASRGRDNRDTRSARDEKPSRERNVHDDEDDSAKGEPDSHVTKRHSAAPENDDERARNKRSSRRRKARGRRRSGERPEEGEPSETASKEVAHSTRNPGAKSKPDRGSDQNDDFDDDFDRDVTDDKARSTKPRNLPTWNETVDVIVQANISSRKKQPPRRRKGGGGSGGQKRQR